jgi:hypothetical protein
MRSDFFVTMVLADAHLVSGEPQQACAVALHALSDGEQLRSARCVSYVREFRQRLVAAGSKRSAHEFDEQARTLLLWRVAASQ